MLSTTIALGFWPQTGLYIGALAVLGVATYLLDRPRLRRLRRQHIESHPPISDEEFVRLAGAQPDRGNVAIGVRNGMAEIMAVPPETIYPSDSLEYIYMLAHDDSFYDIVLFAGKELGVRIPMDFWKPLFPVKREPQDVSLGEVARFMAENWDSISTPTSPRRKKKK